MISDLINGGESALFSFSERVAGWEGRVSPREGRLRYFVWEVVGSELLPGLGLIDDRNERL